MADAPRPPTPVSDPPSPSRLAIVPRSLPAWSRKLVPAAVAMVLAVAAFWVARLPTASAAEREAVASRFAFTEMPVAMPPGYRPTRTVRAVNPAFHHLRSWISSVGASVALTDLRGTGRSDALCLVDTRTDQVVVSYAPTAPASDRFTPFVLNPAPLPMDAAMAPMGCTPGDFNLDGRTDLLVTFWGRTPVMFLARSDATRVTAAGYRPVEVVPATSADGRYHGPRWNTNALHVADLEGDGHPDILIANYFPDSDVLDPQGQNNVRMNSSMSNAKNGGGAHLLRWVGGTSGEQPSASFVEEPSGLPFDVSTGWTLAVSGADLTGDGRPELYLANDFGKDHLLYNRSTPGHVRFTEAVGRRGPMTPKSFAMGSSSFKGMGVDFADLDGNGRFDLVVSNITTAWGLEESNFAWINQARSETDMRSDLGRGVAPFVQRAAELGLAWTGWGWDVKTGDFLNRGSLDVVQASGFVRGKTNRWPWLQEMAMNNDNVFTDPAMWPDLQPGDDLAGHQPFAFYVKDRHGVYQNVSRQLGMTSTVPSRGIALADTRGRGLLDFAVARQWGAPTFYANEAPAPGKYLELHLYRPLAPGTARGGLQAPGAPAYGATVRIRTADGRTQISHLDGGGGHSGRRGFEVHFGLGDDPDPVAATVSWNDDDGRLRTRTLRLAPGEHSLVLNRTAMEVTPS